jgi:transcriptional regulator GlxA family with amidase domain
MRFIGTNAGKPITVADVVEAVSISRRQLERRFRQHTAAPILHAILEAKLALAQHMLADTDLTLDQVAHGCGYTSKSYFCTVFKRELGRTPDKFRELSRRNRPRGW